jgi:hypothetical protein
VPGAAQLLPRYISLVFSGAVQSCSGGLHACKLRHLGRRAPLSRVSHSILGHSSFYGWACCSLYLGRGYLFPVTSSSFFMSGLGSSNDKSLPASVHSFFVQMSIGWRQLEYICLTAAAPVSPHIGWSLRWGGMLYFNGYIFGAVLYEMFLLDSQ